VLVVPVKSISSPCIKICTLIDSICIGCGRSSEEIREWFTASDTRKKEILEKIASGK
jgi:predicted Fe-S protein YdhL (DUF1289 family)